VAYGFRSGSRKRDIWLLRTLQSWERIINGIIDGIIDEDIFSLKGHIFWDLLLKWLRLLLLVEPILLGPLLRCPPLYLLKKLTLMNIRMGLGLKVGENFLEQQPWTLEQKFSW
jgi:hypothetical protein